jgi:BirA family biotin operon repressor/biotin-[acetyl-CoA-carboxylase] ligase
MIAAFDLARIVDETLVQDVEYHTTIPSTNTRVLELAGDPDVPLPLLVLAEQQTAGRGRGTNIWWSASGALTFSLVLGPELGTFDMESWPCIALASAVGVCDALETLAPGARFAIRWPNDICFGAQKICGVLPELQTHPFPRLVLGVGVNLNNSTADAPGPLKATATSLLDVCNRSTDPTDALVRVLTCLEIRINQLRTHDTALTRAWHDRCLLRERIVRMRIGSDDVEGLCKGISRSGGLSVQTREGIQNIHAGTLEAIDGAPLHRPA